MLGLICTDEIQITPVDPKLIPERPLWLHAEFEEMGDRWVQEVNNFVRNEDGKWVIAKNDIPWIPLFGVNDGPAETPDPFDVN